MRELWKRPFNENLVLANEGCNYPVIAALIPCVPAVNTPGYRNEFHAGLQQAIGHYSCDERRLHLEVHA